MTRNSVSQALVSQALVIIKQGIPTPPTGNALTKHLTQGPSTDQTHESRLDPS